MDVIQLSLPDQLKALILSKMSSMKILSILKMYPEMRKVFRKYRKLLPLRFPYGNISDNDLKYFKGAHTINLAYCEYITDRGLKYLKGVYKINLNSCWNISNKGLKYLKGVHTIDLFDCYQITDKGLRYLRDVRNIDLYNCNKISNHGLKHLKRVQHIGIFHYESTTADIVKCIINANKKVLHNIKV